ncbi:MAG: sulfatase-like hydrolase/transferase [Bacilli bacterium]|nr:sulfatase-like hydrolase/transferase [Bacilli bacterium]
MKRIIKKVYLNVIDYVISNRLFLSYVFLSFISTLIIRYATIGYVFSLVSMTIDMAFILILGSFAYILKPQNQFKYLFILMFIYYFTTTSNSIYYTFYTNFASLSLITALSQTGEVADSVFNKLRLLDFVYIPMYLLFYYIHTRLKKSTYYNYLAHVEKGLKNMLITCGVGVILLLFAVAQFNKADYSRLSKQWNREYNVKRFGILMYQANDIVQSLIPKFNTLFGYDKALKEYNDYYALNQKEASTNSYTDMFKGKNLIFIHMESVQGILFDLEFNGKEVVPSTHRLAKEGMYFSNFNPQISVGTSSDTEFTLNTSLMPVLSGTVAVSYYNREYITMEKLLKAQDYYTFSMHGNKASMWNREKLHKSFGYDRFYSEKDFTFKDDQVVGLGISDHDFFQQIQAYLEEIEATHEHYMGTIITLSNHSPFNDLDKYGDYSLTVPVRRYNANKGIYETVNDSFLEGTELGNYLHSAHYADSALGEFFDYVRNSDYFNNTVFILYGDHEAKISRSQYEKYFNHDYQTGITYTKGDSNFKEYDTFSYDLDKSTPLIIWTKDSNLQSKINKEITYPMGMYDVLPTIGNMVGFSSPYALGSDIFTTKNNNIVIFPNGNVLTDKVYYNNNSEEYRVLKNGATISEDYITNIKDYAEKRLSVSNSIILYDLIKKNPIDTNKGDSNE